MKTMKRITGILKIPSLFPTKVVKCVLLKFTITYVRQSIKHSINQSIFVYLMLKSATTVADATVVYRKLLGGQCYTS